MIILNIMSFLTNLFKIFTLLRFSVPFSSNVIGKHANLTFYDTLASPVMQSSGSSLFVLRWVCCLHIC